MNAEQHNQQAELQGRLQYITNQNADRYGALTRQGAGIHEDKLVAMRLEHTINALLGTPDQSNDRLIFEIHWQERLSSVIEKIEKELRKSRLLVPSRNGPVVGDVNAIKDNR